MKQVKAFQGLKTIACLIVFFSHCNGLLNIPLGRMGAVGVEIFIVLSGFLVELRYRENIAPMLQLITGYTKRKVAGFYWLHIVTMLLALAPTLLGWAVESPALQEIKECGYKVLANIFLVQSWIPNSAYYFSLNSVAWYLSTSVMMYVCTPMFHACIQKLATVKHKAMLIVVIFAGQLLLARHLQSSGYLHAVVYVHPLVRIWDYMTGMLLGAIIKEKKVQTTILRGTVCEVAVLVWLFVCLFAGVPDAYYYVTWSAPMAWCIILVFCQESGIISRFLSTRPMRFVGDISLEMFMIHLLVIRYWGYILWIVRKILHTEIHGVISTACVFLISVGAAWILHTVGAVLSKRKVRS